MVPATSILVLVSFGIKGMMSMPLDDGTKDVTPTSVKKMQVHREDLIYVLCSLAERFVPSDIDFKRRFLQRRYSSAPSEADIVGITDEVRLRRLDVLNCCNTPIAPTAGQNRNTTKNDTSLCLDLVRRRRVDLLCSRDTHIVPLNLHGRSFIKKKMPDCCSKLGVTRYNCFENDSLKNTDSSVGYFSLDETDPVNDIWDFPITPSQIQQLIEQHAASTTARPETRQQKRRGITNTSSNTALKDGILSKRRTFDTVNVECACKLQGQDRLVTEVDNGFSDAQASEGGTITTQSLDILAQNGDDGIMGGKRMETKTGFHGFITTIRPSITSSSPAYSLTPVRSDSTAKTVQSTYSSKLERSTSSLTRPTPSFTSVPSTSSVTSMQSTPSPTTVRSTLLYTSTKISQGTTSTNVRPFHPAARIGYFKKKSTSAVTSFLTTVKFTTPPNNTPLYTSRKRQRPSFHRGIGRSHRTKLVGGVRRNIPSTVFPKGNKIRPRTIPNQPSNVTKPLVTSPTTTIGLVKAYEGHPVIRKYLPRLPLSPKSRIPPRPALPRKRIKQNSFRRRSGQRRKKPRHKHRECKYSLVNIEDVDKKLVQGNGVVVF